eukprot:Gb_30913 [translate_table: standard]
MGLFSIAWCCGGHLCAGPGRSEKIKGSVFSNRGAIVSIVLKISSESISSGTGILIHRALVLTTHGTLPSISAAEDSHIVVTRMGIGDSEEYRRKLAPERFFITSSVLDLTVVACDPTETEVVQPLCLHNSIAPCLDYGRIVYLLGRQLTEEQNRDLMVGDGKIIVETDTLIKFSTDRTIWSPGSVGFDIHGNLAFMICDPMKLVSSMASPNRKRNASASFWRKDLPKQFGIPVAVIRHWLSQQWKGSIEELDRPRIPARLKAPQKDKSGESSSGSVKLKRGYKQKEQSEESSSMRAQIQEEEDDEVSRIQVGPENEIVDGSGPLMQGTEMEKKNDLTIDVMPYNPNVGRSGMPEEKMGFPNVGRSSNHERKSDTQKNFRGESDTAQRKEQYLDQESIFTADQMGPEKEEQYLTVIPRKEQDVEGPSVAAHCKGPQKEKKQDLSKQKVYEESIPTGKNEILKVSIPAPQIEIKKEKPQHFGIDVLKVVCKETLPAQPTQIHRGKQQLLDINFPKLMHNETLPTQPTEVQRVKQQLPDINFLPEQEKDREDKTTLLELKETMPSSCIKVKDIEEKKQIEVEPSGIQEIWKTQKADCIETNFHEKYKEPMSSIHVRRLDEKKQTAEYPSTQGVRKKTAAECIESNFPSQHEKERLKSINFTQAKEPMPSICIKLKDVEEKKQTQEEPSTLQETAKTECTESSFPGQYEKERGKSRNLAKFNKPMSTSIRIDLKQTEERKQAKENPPRLKEVWKKPKTENRKPMDNAQKAKEGTVAELEANEDCYSNGSVEDFGTQMSQTSTLTQASSERDTDSSDIETMYSAETRESRNYSPRESSGKTKFQQIRRSQSSMGSCRGVQNWNCDRRYSLPGRHTSALPMHKNQVHPSFRRKISLQMPSYRSPDYFGPTVSSIMKKRNVDLLLGICFAIRNRSNCNQPGKFSLLHTLKVPRIGSDRHCVICWMNAYAGMISDTKGDSIARVEISFGEPCSRALAANQHLNTGIGDFPMGKYSCFQLYMLDVHPG